jgi:hypothetical protein
VPNEEALKIVDAPRIFRAVEYQLGNDACGELRFDLVVEPVPVFVESAVFASRQTQPVEYRLPFERTIARWKVGCLRGRAASYHQRQSPELRPRKNGRGSTAPTARTHE